MAETVEKLPLRRGGLQAPNAVAIDGCKGPYAQTWIEIELGAEEKVA